MVAGCRSLTDKPSADRPYTCAELQTREFYGYGTYEVRMRSAAALGTVSVVFYVHGLAARGSATA